MSINTCQFYSTLLSLSRHGMDVIRRVANSESLGVEYKGENDPVTIADITVQTYIEATLANLFPGLKVYGEESVEISDQQ